LPIPACDEINKQEVIMDIKNTQQLFQLLDGERKMLDLSGRKLSESAGASCAFWLAVKSNNGNMTVRSLLAVCDSLGLKITVSKKGKK